MENCQQQRLKHRKTITMFRIFKKRKRKIASTLSEKAAGKIKSLILKVKCQFAETMSQYEQRLSTKQKKVALAVFCLIMCSLSSFWLYQGVFKINTDNPGYLKQNKITIPHDITLPDSLNTELMEELKQRLEHHKQKADSIKK